MIHYDAGAFRVRNLSKLTGSVFWATLPAAGLCGLLGLVMRILGTHVPVIAGVLEQDGSAYGSFSVLMGFLVIFRTQTGYSRFWQGAQYVKDMQLEFYATASNLVAFSRNSTAGKEEVHAFQCVLIRLVSLLSAVALHDLNGRSAVGKEYRLEVVDPNGLDSASLLTLWHEQSKVELLVQWVQSLAVDSIKSGILAVPPPVLARAFQSLSAGLKAYYCAHRLKEVPYPFPYVQTTELLLLLHCIVTPLVMVGCTTSFLWTAVFSFFIPLIVLGLNRVACELEDPFGMDHNDLDLSDLQRLLNDVLLMLMQPATRVVPTLSKNARSLVTCDKKLLPVDLLELGDMLETLAPSGDVELRGEMFFLPRGATTSSMTKMIKGGKHFVVKQNVNSGPESSYTAQSEGSACDRSPQTGDRDLEKGHGGARAVTSPAVGPDSDGPRRQSRDSGTWTSISSDVISPQHRHSLRIVFEDSTRSEEPIGRTFSEDAAMKAVASSAQSQQAPAGFPGALEEKLCFSGRDLVPVVPRAPAADAPEQRTEGSCHPQSLSLSGANLPPLRYALDDTSSHPFGMFMEKNCLRDAMERSCLRDAASWS